MAVAVSPLATPALDNQGSPVTLCGRVSGPNRQEFCYDGTFAGQNSTFSPYTVSAHSAYRFVISCPPRLDGCAPNSDLMGSIRVIPSGQGDAPVPLTVFTFKPGAFTVGEAGAPANRGAAFRMYVEASETPDIHTGIAVTNMSGTARNVILELFDLNGAAFMSRAINLGASSQFVNFLDDTALFPNMPKPFKAYCGYPLQPKSVSLVYAVVQTKGTNS